MGAREGFPVRPNSILILTSSPYLPRIPGDGDIIRALVSAGSGCHNSTAPYFSHAAGFPPSPWEAVRKYHCAPTQSWRPKCHLRSTGWRRSLAAVLAAGPGGAPVSLVGRLCTDNAVSSVFKVRERVQSLSLTFPLRKVVWFSFYDSFSIKLFIFSSSFTFRL